MKSVAFHNLGCKVNSYEMEVMQQIMRQNGYRIVGFDEIADIYIINTCTVTNIADRKSRQMIHRARQRNPRAVIVAAGCYVQTASQSGELDGEIDLAVGNNRKRELPALLEEYLRRREEAGCRNPGAEEKPDPTLDGTTILDIAHTSEYEEMRLLQPTEHTRADIKIQDGCNQFCSYCAIPLARGRVRSRRRGDVLAEVQGVVEKGCSEVVLTGIHISSYGEDAPEEGGLIELIESVHEVPGLLRLRLGSLEPRIVTEENVRRLAALPKLCPHFHLSLQSGCDETLKRMNRHYTTEEYLRGVELLRAAFDHPAITTDVIVGFPGETREEFDCTRAFLERVCFYEMHIFKYSRRKGTRAASMPGQLTEAEKSERSRILQELERRQSASFRKRLLGRTAEVLFEEPREIGGEVYLVGHTRDYVKAAVLCREGAGQAGETRSDGLRPGALARLRLTGFLEEDIITGVIDGC